MPTTKRLSFETILLTLLVGVHISLKYTNIAVQLMPEVALVTVLVIGSTVLFWWLDLLDPPDGRLKQRIAAWKSTTILLLIGFITILPTILMMYFHVHLEAPHSFMHDGLVQNQAAVDYVLEGKNPYVEDYFGTPLEKWPNPFPELPANPPLYHYVYLPFTFLLPLPFQWLGEAALGWFDERVLFLLFLLLTLFLGPSLIEKGSSRRMWMMIVGLNPLFVPSFIEGRNDIVLIFAVVLILLLLRKNRVLLSAVVLALACATKQFAWFLVPFYFLVVGGDGVPRERLQRALHPLIAFATTFAVVMAPWILLNFGAFWEDTFGYLSGSTPGAFPIAGVGFAQLLVQIGVIPSITSPFPHSVMQLAVGVPVTAALIWRQWRNNRIEHALVHYVMVLFAFTYFACCFFDSYIGYMIAIATTGALMSPVQVEE